MLIATALSKDWHPITLVMYYALLADAPSRFGHFTLDAV
jgi:hypothetical protein